MQDFTRWIEESHRLAQATSEGDKIEQILQAAGPAGVSESDLRKSVKLDRRILDGILNAMLQIKMIAAVERNGERVFLSTCPVQISM